MTPSRGRLLGIQGAETELARVSSITAFSPKTPSGEQLRTSVNGEGSATPKRPIYGSPPATPGFDKNRPKQQDQQTPRVSSSQLCSPGF